MLYVGAMGILIALDPSDSAQTRTYFLIRTARPRFRVFTVPAELPGLLLRANNTSYLDTRTQNHVISS